MSDAMLAIAAASMRSSCANEPDLVERIRKAFKEAQSFWMSTDDDLRFRGALGAVLLETKDEAEKERLTRNISVLKALNAMMAGVPVDVERALAELGTSEPLPLMKLWHEAKDAKK